MSFSTLYGLALKVLKPLIQICKWFLVKMASISGLKGRKGAKGSVRERQRGSDWRWRRVVVLLCFMVFFVLIWGLVDGKLSWKIEDGTLGNCYARMEKITSLAWHRESGHGMPPSSTISCLLKFLGSENQIFHRPCKLVTGEMSSSSIENTSFSSASCEENELQSRELHSNATNHCEGIYMKFVEICSWIVVGMAISYTLFRLYKGLRSLKHGVSQSTGNWRKKLLVFFVICGVSTSIFLFWRMNRDIMLRRKETLESMCDERARMLQDQFNVSMNHVHALAILVSTFHHGKQPSAIDQKTFEDYTEITAFERPLTSGVSYALRVRHSERQHIEQQYGWTIKKMDIENQTLAQDCNPERFTTSPAQDEYAPVIFSQRTVSHILSIDMMSGKEDRENILRARASGKGVLTSPFKLLKSNHLGVVLTFAVYKTNLPLDARPEERINATVGYLGAAYDVPSLVKKLLHQLASKQTIIVNVYDTTNRVAPINMYGPDVADVGLLRISPLDFGDPTRKHEMHCRFKQKPPLPLQAIATAGGVLVITLLVGHIFHEAIKQITKVEHDYREMMELKHRAEAADVAKSQFLATVSHEIRTPMNGVLGMLQMLMDTNLDACQVDYAQTAHDSGKDLISLINKVLDQAKIESGRLELEAVPFDLCAVLDRILTIFSGRSHEKGIELAVYVSDKVPEVVVGDQERFGQIVTNLVGNSIKFTPDKGHIFVSVHLVEEVKLPLDMKDEVLRQSLNIVQDDLNSNAAFNTLSGFRAVDRWKSWENFKNIEEESGKIKLLVTVEDTGTGIPPEAQGRIFTPFMQADSSTSRKYGGTGIGLSISKRLVDLMGGEIGFASELNVGSTFTFTVPFTKAETSSLDKMGPAISDFRGLRALVIDEKRIRAQVTKYHLQRLGICVDISPSMESACSLFSSSDQFAMVLIDQEDWDDTCLPFHNLIRTIRQDSSRGKDKHGYPLKIFLLSTAISSTDRNKLDELVDNLISKPLRLSVLLSTFQQASGKRLDRPSTTLSSVLKGKHILVVDDNAVNRRVAEGALKKYGVTVTCVDCGKTAVELLKPPHMFSACFMDLQMPEMDGFEATRRIRSNEKEYNERMGSGERPTGALSGWRTPILAMTADVIQATNDACMKCGMDEYVPKPFGEEQLYSAVARFFQTS